MQIIDTSAVEIVPMLIVSTAHLTAYQRAHLGEAPTTIGAADATTYGALVWLGSEFPECLVRPVSFMDGRLDRSAFDDGVIDEVIEESGPEWVSYVELLAHIVTAHPNAVYVLFDRDGATLSGVPTFGE